MVDGVARCKRNLNECGFAVDSLVGHAVYNVTRITVALRCKRCTIVVAGVNVVNIVVSAGRLEAG